MKEPSITLIVLTFNEEVHLARCLESVKDLVSEVVVVDSHSTDGTKGVAEKFGARFVEHDFTNQAEQFNWALANVPIKGEWILRLDADEYLLPELREEIGRELAKASPDVSGFYMKRRVYFMGRWIKHGGYYPAWFLRLFRKGKGEYEMREMDEHIVLREGRAEHLRNDFIDHKLTDIEEFIERHTRYAGQEAKAILREKNMRGSQGQLKGNQPEQKKWLKQNVYLRLPPFFRAFLYFLYRYVFRAGFLDGKEGLMFHFLQGCWYRFLVDTKLYEFRKSTKKNF